MPKSLFPHLRKLKTDLQSFLKKEKFLVDLFLFGSAFKGKEKPNDIDLIALFREKNYEKVENIIYQLSKIGERLKIKLHIEPIIIDQLYDQKIYPSLIHEGYSIKHNKFLHEKLNFGAFLLINYGLEGKTSSDKVRFSYALYGREKGEGLLKQLKGKLLGKGSLLVPIGQQEVIKAFFQQWDVKYNEQRILLFK